MLQDEPMPLRQAPVTLRDVAAVAGVQEWHGSEGSTGGRSPRIPPRSLRRQPATWYNHDSRGGRATAD